MIEVIDRVPTHPGRVRLTPVAGQANVYDMERSDNPTTVGTPINKALFDSIGSDISILNQNVANIINNHASLTPIGGMTAGTEFGIYENGILVPYIKVAGDYNGSGRSVVMRKHLYKRDFLNTSTQYNTYAGGLTDTWLNTEYIGLLEGRVKDAIAAVMVPCTGGNGDRSIYEVSRKVFLASLTELGISDEWYNVEGTAFPYFNSYARRKALFNGSAMFYWTRSPHPSFTNTTAYINGDGTHGSDSAYSLQAGIRPVFTLAHDFEINISGTSTANVMAEAEVI